MARYAIGDIQGCYEALQRLLQRLHFKASHDVLYFCGDLIARGPDSLQTLRFIKNLGASANVVLGNHDLNFLASRHGYGRIHPDDQLDALLNAPDCDELAAWLQQQPLLIREPNAVIVHAGIAPDLSMAQAELLAEEVAVELRLRPASLFAQMYGNQPDCFEKATTNIERWRYAINSMTRMRYCSSNGRLDFKEKGGLTDNPALVPWYSFWEERPHPNIYFGHWAALNGYSPVERIFALDTGCVWGNQLTAICMDTHELYSVEGYKKDYTNQNF